MLPYGDLYYHGAPAALQDIPLGTHLHGVFYHNAKDNKSPPRFGPYRRVAADAAFTRFPSGGRFQLPDTCGVTSWSSSGSSLLPDSLSGYGREYAEVGRAGRSGVADRSPMTLPFFKYCEPTESLANLKAE